MGTELVIFLDFDDVVCLNQPYGAYDAMLAMGEVDSGEKTLEDHADLWAGLFDKAAVGHLKAIHQEFAPTYVLSTSWIKFLSFKSFDCILRQSGLPFVADSLHDDWSTTRDQRNGVRSDEIRGWLGRHPECQDCWVVLDDEHSGTGLPDWPVGAERGFITLCKRGVGLTSIETEHVRASLLLRGEVIRT